MDEKTAKELIKTRKAVRQKYNALKSNITEQNIRLEKELKPLTLPLQELIRTIKSEPLIKTEPQSPKLESTTKFQSSPLKERKSNIYKKYLPHNVPTFLDDGDVFLSYSDLAHPQTEPSDRFSSTVIEPVIEEPTAEELHEQLLDMTTSPAYQEYLEAFDPHVRDYIDNQIKDTTDAFDFKYGIKHDMTSDKLKIANTDVDFEGKDLKVGSLRYLGTPGLYELLFKKNPLGYKKGDLDNYMDILKRTNAYRRNFDPKQQIQGSNDSKYTQIIKPYLVEKGILRTTSISSSTPSTSGLSGALFSQPSYLRPRTRIGSVAGKGLKLKLSKNKIDYIYFDDVNEIVDRLKLLVASQTAGHTGHNNEIVSILEELREAKIIK
jgi:hypothetical protein